MIQIGFFTLPILMVFAIIYLFTFSPEKSTLIKRFLAIVLIWALYLITLRSTGLLNSFDLPPRIPLLMILPAIVSIFLLSRSSLVRNAIQKIPSHSIVYFQSFRIIVEILIYGAFLEGIIPQQVTFEGTNFDILVGITAIPMGYLIQSKRASSKAILVWNFSSLAILGLTVVTAIYTLYTTELTAQNLKFVTFPYLLLPGALVPTAVFLHVISIRQALVRVNQTASA